MIIRIVAINSYFNKVIKAYDTMLEEPNAEFQYRLSKFVKLTTTMPKVVPRCIGIDANQDEDQVFESVKQAVETIMWGEDERTRICN